MKVSLFSSISRPHILLITTKLLVVLFFVENASFAVEAHVLCLADGGDAKSGGSSPVMTGDKTEASDLQRRARRTFNRYKQLDPSVVMQLKRQEQQKQSQLVQEELKHSQISSQILDMRLQTQTKLQNLRVLERQLSNQAGALLAALQREEGRANKVAATVKGIRSTRKQLLAKITTPRWEVKHHYHMCVRCCAMLL